MQKFKRPKLYDDSDSEKETEKNAEVKKTTMGPERPPSRPEGPERPPKKIVGPQRPPKTGTSNNELTTDELNKLKAKAMKAQIQGDPNASLYEKEYEAAKAGPEPQTSTESSLIKKRDKNKRKKIFRNTHGPDGERTNYYQDDDKSTLDDLVREEKKGVNRSIDQVMFKQIQKDSRFVDNLEYLDESAERVGDRHKSNEDRIRNMDYKESKALDEALERCLFCYTPERVPQISVAALGNKTYLGLPDTVDLMSGHCFIVPTSHVMTSLECDDDVWDEIRNFQKCLIRMFAAKRKAVVFMEQAVYFKYKRHCVIECIPVPQEEFNTLPAYFKEGILQTAPEWSQNRKIIETQKNGFRRSMVPNLPYFHVWFDLNGGIGHVIEEEKEWPSWFGKEIIAGVLDIDPHRWRRPRKIEPQEAETRLAAFKKMYDPYDWTKLLDE